MGRVAGTAGLTVTSLFRPVDGLVGRLRDFIPEGATVLVARAVGRDDGTGLRVVASAIGFSLAVNLAIGAVGLAAIAPITDLLAGDLAIADPLRWFLIPWFIAQPVTALAFVLHSSVTSSGWTRFGMFRNVLGVALLAGLLPLCMATLDMGVAGAHTALGVSSLVLAWITAMAIRARRDSLRLGEWPPARAAIDRAAWRAMTRIGLPSQLARAADFLAQLFLVVMVARDGATEVAAYGVALALFLLPANLTQSVGRACGMMIAQNIGAGRDDRARAAVWTGLALACGFAVAMTLAYGFLDPIVGLFTDDPRVIARTGDGLDILRLSFPAVAAYQVLLASYTAIAVNRLASAASVGFAAASVVLAHLLPMDGLEAAAVSMLVTYALRALVFLALFPAAFRARTRDYRV